MLLFFGSTIWTTATENCQLASLILSRKNQQTANEKFCQAGLSCRRRLGSGMRWLLSSAAPPSMASSNADRVVMAAMPVFGFLVDAPNVATPRRLRDGKDTNETSDNQANVFLNESTGCLPKDMNNTGTVGKNTRLDTIQDGIQKEIPSWAPTIRDTHTHTNRAHTIKLNEYKREGRHAT
jgi:hypothetical protein